MKRAFPKNKSVSTMIGAAMALILGASSLTAHADSRRHRDDRYRDFGRVIDVRPVYREVAVREPQLQCRTEHERGRYRHPRRGHRDDGHARLGGALVGGVIGGTIGNRLARHGRHHDRVAATVAGAVIGSALGHGVSHDYTRVHRGHDRGRHFGHDRRYERHHRRPVERCYRSTTTRYETQLSHYDVTYVFRGRTFHARRDRHPGQRIEIDISKRPAHR